MTGLNRNRPAQPENLPETSAPAKEKVKKTFRIEYRHRDCPKKAPWKLYWKKYKSASARDKAVETLNAKNVPWDDDVYRAKVD